MKAEFGGGTRGFSCEEDFIYENVESELRFFTSQVRPVPRVWPSLGVLPRELTTSSQQERQSIIRFWLQNLRAKQGEALHNVRFLEDQPISERGGANTTSTGIELGRALRGQSRG